MTQAGTILLVDDDDDIREVVAMLLETEGYRVRTAADGLEALQQLQSGHGMALLIIDLMMPRIDGIQLIQIIRSSELQIPIVVMSGHDGAERRARELGADGCIVKPIDADDLFQMVACYVG